MSMIFLTLIVEMAMVDAVFIILFLTVFMSIMSLIRTTSMTKATDDEQELLEKQSHLESHKAILDSNILNLQNHVKTVTFFSLKGLHHKIVSL